MLKSRLFFTAFSLIIFILVPVAGWSANIGEGTEPVIAPIPSEVSSSHFTVTVGNRRSPVVHAVNGYYLLNFDIVGPTPVTVTSDDPHYWDAGVEVQPMRLGIRPHRDGGSITFLLQGPAKLSITRPGDHFSDSEMLFLFANNPDLSDITPDTPGIRYFGPGVHKESIDAKSGDRIYLAAGAIIFGSLNIWQVHDVHVFGRGAIIYDGPQNPDHDEGWIHKPNWHAIVMDHARNIEIDGITAIVRSRTWMVQMEDSHAIIFHNVKIIGGNRGNANQDGMDWLGGGDTLVQDSFIRAADDIFAMYGNWDGYSSKAMTTPGQDVSNITIENSVLSTSISNVVRLGWPEKIFDSQNFTLRNSDVLQMGVGSCGVPFALFEIWADPGGKGEHSGIQFENIRLDDLYSLVQLRQPNPGIRDVTFKNIWSMDGPSMAPSVLKGDVSGVTFSGVDLGSGDINSNSQLPIEILNGAQAPNYTNALLDASFTYSSGLIRPGSAVVFSAKRQPGLTYHWLFGDGSTADGQVVKHSFPDEDGTLLDHTGRFRILLSVFDDLGHISWSSQSIVVSASILPAVRKENLSTGLLSIKDSSNSYQGFLNVPFDGGYTVTLLTSASASLIIDGVRIRNATPRPQVCGSSGDAVQALRLSLALARGLHRISIERGTEIENAAYPDVSANQPLLFWEGPKMRRQLVPPNALFHLKSDQ